MNATLQSSSPTPFSDAAPKLSQADKILARLRAAGGKWVSLPELHRASGAYAVHSRACDLRKRGLNIENMIGKDTDGISLSWYRIVEACAP